MNEVVVTGLGIVTQFGAGGDFHWQLLSGEPLAGRRRDEGFDGARAMVDQAAGEALTQAGFWQDDTLHSVDPERVGCTVSASKPFFPDSGADVIPPERINEYCRSRFGLGGEARNTIAACATGAYSIALAASWIEQGLCDIVLAGSVEPAAHPLIAAGFAQMGVLSADGITRPFDQQRCGFGFGQGAGIVVLESRAHAAKRGGRLLARLSGWGLGADGHSAVAFNSNGQKIADVIARALGKAQRSPSEVRHVNAHGTGTRQNDWIETQALRKAFGSAAEQLMISATKATTGHLLGAAGSIEFIFTVLALRHQFILPTTTLESADPECALDYTPRQGHRATFDHAMSLSFGFGGPIGALVVSR